MSKKNRSALLNNQQQIQLDQEDMIELQDLRTALKQSKEDISYKALQDDDEEPNAAQKMPSPIQKPHNNQTKTKKPTTTQSQYQTNNMNQQRSSMNQQKNCMNQQNSLVNQQRSNMNQQYSHSVYQQPYPGYRNSHIQRSMMFPPQVSFYQINNPIRQPNVMMDQYGNYIQPPIQQKPKTPMPPTYLAAQNRMKECPSCQCKQNIPSNVSQYYCCNCKQLNNTNPSYGIFICGDCRNQMAYPYQKSQYIECSNCSTINRVPLNPQVYPNQKKVQREEVEFQRNRSSAEQPEHISFKKSEGESSIKEEFIENIEVDKQNIKVKEVKKFSQKQLI